MKVTSMKITTVFGALAMLLAAGASSAATIAPGAVVPDPVVPDIFDVTISGADFLDGTLGGGLTVTWDAALLDLVSWDTTVFPGDQSFAGDNTTTVLDQAAGSLSNLSVASFLTGAPGPTFDIVTLTFLAQADGTSPITTAIGQFDSGADIVWADETGFFNTNPTFLPGSVTINAVPVPAAVWLFGSGLLGMVGIARRKRAA